MAFVRAVYLAALFIEKKIVQEKFRRRNLSEAEYSKEVCFCEEILSRSFDDIVLSFFRSFVLSFFRSFDDFPSVKKYIHLSKPRR
jgi:hypothetical protein